MASTTSPNACPGGAGRVEGVVVVERAVARTDSTSDRHRRQRDDRAPAARHHGHGHDGHDREQRAARRGSGPAPPGTTSRPAAPSRSPRSSGRHLTPPGQDQARPEAREPQGHVGVHVAGGLAQAPLVEVRDRRGRVLGAQDLDQADHRDPQPEDRRAGRWPRRLASARARTGPGPARRARCGWRRPRRPPADRPRGSTGSSRSRSPRAARWPPGRPGAARAGAGPPATAPAAPAAASPPPRKVLPRKPASSAANQMNTPTASSAGTKDGLAARNSPARLACGAAASLVSGWGRASSASGAARVEATATRRWRLGRRRTAGCPRAALRPRGPAPRRLRCGKSGRVSSVRAASSLRGSAPRESGA